MTKHIPIITIDGFSGSGKSTLCRLIANALKWNLLDSGAIYRTLAFITLNNNINIASEKDIISVIPNLDIQFITCNTKIKVFLYNKDITNEISNLKISETASYIAQFPLVRKLLLTRQHSFIQYPGLIADGRDMGTVVFPNANIKFFLKANLKQRTQRRMLELKEKGFNVKFSNVLAEIKKRDERDCNRKCSPLLPAPDALVYNSTQISIKQLFNKILIYIHKKIII
ncbi:MAG: (d)CMP kinase [Pantoea sp. Brub]|nr:(d)CMP kinase [Pantoea sp. Brub]